MSAGLIATVAGHRPGTAAPAVTPPRMVDPGTVTDIRYGTNVPQVSADRLMATGFTFRGTVDLPTRDGAVKALVFHADHLKGRQLPHLNIRLPAFSGNDVKAGQVFIRAGTVRGGDLSADVVASRAARA